MGSFAHILKANKTRQRPRNWLIFDCEALIGDTPDGGQEHRLRIGCGRYRRYPHGRHVARQEDFDFTTHQDFWRTALGLCERDRRLVLVGYNVGYDIRLVRAFQYLHAVGYRQKRIYVGGKVVIVEWTKGKHHITALDAMNYFDGSLESWGTMLGLDKIQVDFRRCSDKKLLEHCRRDVEILDALMLRWFDFVDSHDLGCFSITRASQAMTAFRHRFMDHRIWVHANDRATAIERAAYHGGRTECFHIGDVPGGPFHKLDINAHYPHVMSKTPVPVKFRSLAIQLTVADLRRLVRRYALCGMFDVQTDQPAYVYTHDGEILYPVGRFEAYLSTPEIVFALRHKHILKGLRVCIYDKAVVFRSYVKYLYRLRQKYRKAGNQVFGQMVKYMMNSLYGKFGQRSENWKRADNEFFDGDGEYNILDDETGELYRYVVIVGERWNITGRGESHHSFTAIAAHITAAARMYLWGLICLAGRRNVFYCDTDSLIVNAAGFRRLKAKRDDSRLGLLKHEYVTRRLIIRSPKEYKTDTESRCKGIKTDAVKIGPRQFRQLHWEGLRGAIAAGMTDRVILRPVVKHLASRYHKGIVHASGSVSPIVLSDTA